MDEGGFEVGRQGNLQSGALPVEVPVWREELGSYSVTQAVQEKQGCDLGWGRLEGQGGRFKGRMQMWEWLGKQ